MKPRTYFIQTLGCPKNEADSDRLTRALDDIGYDEATASEASLIVVNTCGFIDAAKEESIDAILDATAAAHESGAAVAAVGCLVERYRDELAAELPEVELWCGLDWTPLLTALEHGERGEAALGGDPNAQSNPDAGRTNGRASVPGEEARRVRRRAARPVHAYVKVSDGCDRRCSYCAIPLIKGDYEASAPGRILQDARAALAAGARELVLVGQDTSRWSWPGWGGLERLLAELRALGPAWLRLLYLQPDGIDDALLGAMAAHAVPYLDVPLQHASGTILRRMGRSGDGARYLELLALARRALPGATVRSTFIAGFPGETEADVDELVSFIAEAGLAVAGVFVFDAQDGTRAASLPGQVPLEVRLARAARVSEAIDRAAETYWADLVGREVELLVEQGTRQVGGEAVARLAAQAPDIDGRTLLTGRAVHRGQLVHGRVVGTLGYDVAAVALP